MIVLSAQDLIELTDKVKPSAQARVLDAMRIPYRKRPDGTLVVARIHVETIELQISGDARLPAEPQLVLEP